MDRSQTRASTYTCALPPSYVHTLMSLPTSSSGPCVIRPHTLTSTPPSPLPPSHVNPCPLPTWIPPCARTESQTPPPWISSPTRLRPPLASSPISITYALPGAATSADYARIPDHNSASCACASAAQDGHGECLRAPYHPPGACMTPARASMLVRAPFLPGPLRETTHVRLCEDRRSPSVFPCVSTSTHNLRSLAKASPYHANNMLAPPTANPSSQSSPSPSPTPVQRIRE